MGLLRDLVDSFTGATAARESRAGAEISAQGQREQLDYLKEVEALPLEMRNRLLPQLEGVYTGGPEQQSLIDSAQNSPLYQAIMGGQQIGEEAIMRNASMTGDFRSGNVKGDLTDYGSQLSNQALLKSYNQQLQGIQGLAGLNLNTNNIGNAISAPSGTIAQGGIAAAQARQDGIGNVVSAAPVVGGLIKDAWNYFSDIRLKENIKQIGRKNGINLYSWNWNGEAEQFGLTGEGKGVLAHEVYKTHPEHITEKDGYIMVNYSALGLEQEAA